MTIRIFRCGYCGHKMRTARATCGSCHQSKRAYQRIPVLILAGLGVLTTMGVLLTT